MYSDKQSKALSFHYFIILWFGDRYKLSSSTITRPKKTPKPLLLEQIESKKSVIRFGDRFLPKWPWKISQYQFSLQEGKKDKTQLSHKAVMPILWTIDYHLPSNSKMGYEVRSCIRQTIYDRFWWWNQRTPKFSSGLSSQSWHTGNR